MTRRAIAVEGRASLDGRVIEVGALEWRDEPIPVQAIGSDPFPYIVGKATDLRREDDNTITADIQITGRELDDDEYPAVFVLISQHFTGRSGLFHVKRGRIAMITLTGTWVWSE